MKTMFVASALFASIALPASAQICENTATLASYNVSRNYTGAYSSYASRSAKRSTT